MSLVGLWPKFLNTIGLICLARPSFFMVTLTYEKIIIYA